MLNKEYFKPICSEQICFLKRLIIKYTEIFGSWNETWKPKSHYISFLQKSHPSPSWWTYKHSCKHQELLLDCLVVKVSLNLFNKKSCKQNSRSYILSIPVHHLCHLPFVTLLCSMLFQIKQLACCTSGPQTLQVQPAGTILSKRASVQRKVRVIFTFSNSQW